MGEIKIPEPADIPATADIVVIGGGIVGCATAFWASQAGLATVLLEKREALCILTTPASAEAVRCQFEERENVEMMKASLDIFEHCDEIIGIPGYNINFHQQGYLFITSKDNGPQTLQERVRRQHSWGLPDVEYLDGKEARHRFPYLAPIVTAATFRQRDGWLSTQKVTYGFAKGSTARIFLKTEATGFILDKMGISGVQTNRGPIYTRVVVIAAGPFSGVLAELAEVKLPLTIERRQKVIIRSPLVSQNAPMTIDLDTGAYWHPEPGGVILGWAEAVKERPSKPLDFVSADMEYPTLAIKGCSRLTQFWKKITETLKHEDVVASAGQYTITPDAKPILSPLIEVPGLFFNGGYRGHGIMGAPEGGRRIVEMIMGRLPAEDNPFRRERFVEIGVKKERLMI
ncbi:MAG: FAD-binding oxidoreductase [Desulfobacterales bacterium]|nr:FAD-binding oxidoreductase [Desulfobacterales bacterium]